MKLCLGCMEQMEDSVTTCPHCGFNEATFTQESYYLTPGTIVGGKYILGKVVKYGGYTVTYIGMDAEKNQKVMIKEYLPSEFSTRSAGEKEVTIYLGDALELFNQGLTTFLNEANRIQHLENSKGIAKVYDCVAENDTGYVISEYVEGQTLKELMESKGKFSWQEAKDFVSQILEGLSLVHPMDIIHCDISPDTIMLTKEGEVKLLDFGSTRYVTTANSSSLAIILKQGFAPEEQYRSQGVRGPWTDVYALGAVMYYMVTGTVPLESVDRALLDELKEPSKLGISIPQNVENAMMNALNIYQKDRTPSAEAFLRELNSAEVKRIQVKQKRRETGKFPVWAKVLVAGLLCVVVAGGVVVFRTQSQKQQQQSEMGQGGKSQALMQNIIGKTPEEAEEIFEKEDAYKGLNLSLQKSNEQDFIFTQDYVGKIASQSVEERKELSKGTKVEYVLGDNTRIHYSDINEYKDARALLDAMKISDKGEGIEEAAEAQGKPYGSLAKIRMKDGSVLTDMKDTNKQAQVIEIANIDKVFYYACDFFYTKKIGNQVGRQISKVTMNMYKKDKNGKRKLTKKAQSVDGASFVDDSYYTFETGGNYVPGVVTRQTQNSGKFDASSYSDVLFKVIHENGNLSSMIGKTGNEVSAKIREIMGNKNITIQCEDKTATVTGVTIKQNGNVVKVFSSNDANLEFTIQVEKKVVTPAPTSVPTPKATLKSSSGSDTKSSVSTQTGKTKIE